MKIHWLPTSAGPCEPRSLSASLSVGQVVGEMSAQAAQAAKEGRMADAQQEMAQLEKMLDQLRNARDFSGPVRREAAHTAA